MANTSQSTRRAALLVSAVAVLGLTTTACGGGSGTASGPQTQSGTAAPVGGDASADGSGTPVGSSSGSGTATGSSPAAASSGSATSTPSGSGSASGDSARCHTSELKASVGGNDPGAGQENFPIVLTNSSGRTCTVRGYPGAAFVNASGTQLGPDPVRETSGGTGGAVTLKPGQSAWAGLTFSNPEISGAKTATPTTLVVTPPDEKASLDVKWTGGAVPVSGNSSSVRLTVFSAGTGA
ncbi:DUF4232 domain-containing protein [Streptomyces sp. NPDC091280]|uniref:DUF4232 domain-containing protein n=1 Tax=Streptomyces sp. NPDC091280 TaxID=3365984 RepID=UPI0038023394